jgi:hypothetical protein
MSGIIDGIAEVELELEFSVDDAAAVYVVVPVWEEEA